jgi:hypothetical protein
MTPTPPPGSQISVQSVDGDSVIVIPQGAGSVWRYGAGLFVLFWLGGWFFGFRSAATQLLTGNTPGQAQGFLIFWLGAWTLGGLLALYYVFRLFRPSIPESFRLKRNGLSYDSGIPPFQFYSRYTNQKEAWKALFPKRAIVEIDRAQLATLRLRDTESGNRLTVDANAARLSLASAGSEIDREWLYKLLAERYSLPAAG